MDIETILKELQFKAVRSSGPGGQHVNKTATKVAVSFTIPTSEALTVTEKNRLSEKLSFRISSEGVLILTCGETRSQHRNKAIAIARMVELIEQNLKVAKPRKKQNLLRVLLKND